MEIPYRDTTKAGQRSPVRVGEGVQNTSPSLNLASGRQYWEDTRRKTPDWTRDFQDCQNFSEMCFLGKHMDRFHSISNMYK